MRRYTYKAPPRAQISEAEAYERTVRACNTLARLPDADRRFLVAGQGSCLAKLGSVLTWHDANAHIDTKLEPVVRVRRVMPTPEIKMTMAIESRATSGGPAPMRISDAARQIAIERSRHMRVMAHVRGRLADKYVAAPGFIPGKEPDEREDRAPLTRAAITDAQIAGGWFASLALLEWNIDEFSHACREWQRGRRGRPWVDDQKIIWRHARGVSLRTIGTELSGGKLNEHQVEHRLTQISGHLADIANGRARLVDPVTRSGRQANGRGRAKADLATD